MRKTASLPLLMIAAAGACSTPGGPYPSLQPRAAEAIDPRVAVVPPTNTRPVDPALASRLAGLIANARSGDSAFQRAAAQAEQLAATAGARQSESWIAAQEALSAAVAARAPTARALGDIDALGANRLAAQGGLAPADLSAIQTAAKNVGAIDRREAERVAAIQRRLGI